MKYLFLSLLLCPLILLGQESKGIIIKTLIFQDIFYQNPNVTIEKRLNSTYSVELLAGLRNGDWVFIGGEGPPIPSFYNCNGFTVGLSTRYYFPSKRSTQNSWYASGLLRYNETYIKKVGFFSGIHSLSRVVSLSRKGPELGIVFGRQFFIFKHITIEFYLGAGTYMQIYKEKYISGIESEVITKDLLFTFRPYLGWTIGYFFRKSK